MSGQHIEATVETVVVDLGQRDARDVFKCRALIPMLGDAQLRALRTKAGRGQHGSPSCHGTSSLPGSMSEPSSVCNPSPMPERKTEPRLTEIAHPLHTQATHIGHLPAREGGLRQCALDSTNHQMKDITPAAWVKAQQEAAIKVQS